MLKYACVKQSCNFIVVEKSFKKIKISLPTYFGK